MRKESENGGLKRLMQFVSNLVAALWCAAAVIVALPEAAIAGPGWDVAADAGVLVTNTYMGSDEYFVAPLPAFKATRTVGNSQWYISLPLEGAGLTRLFPSTGLIGSLALQFGSQREREEYSMMGFPVRHDDETRAFLAGSPNVSTPVVVEASLQYPTRLGIFGASLGYHPTSMAHDRPGVADMTRHGFVLGLQYTKPVRVTSKLSVTGIGTLAFMDGNYAESWFAVDQATKSLSLFDADAGLRNVEAAVYVDYALTSRANIAFYYSGMTLLTDAANSPYTLDKYQQTFMSRMSWAF